MIILILIIMMIIIIMMIKCMVVNKEQNCIDVALEYKFKENSSIQMDSLYKYFQH